MEGVKCGFFSGDVTKLIEDCGILKPTFFPSVPRLYNKIHGKISDGINNATGMKGWLAKTALDTKITNLKTKGWLKHCMYDALVFKKIRNLLGGRVRIMVSGSAPISGDVLNFLKACFSCPIIEAYGMTETAGGSVATFAAETQPGVVGGPL